MSNYNSLKTAIDANIKQNGKQEITGPVLNSVLNAMVDTLGAGYQFAGIAVSDTNPGTPDAKVFYIANGKGAYTNFSGLDVTEDEVVVLYYDTEWHKVSTGIASQAKLSELQTTIDSKQDTISDLDDIREGAALGKTALQEHQDISGLATKKEVATKQDKISDLDTIRSGAAKGATALQSETDPIYSADKPSLALKSELNGKQDTISDLESIREGAALGKTALQEHQDISKLATKEEVATKQDTISDLATIRSGAAKGATALQSYTESDPIYTADKPSLALKSEIPDISGKQDKISDLDDIRKGAAKGATALQSYTETDPIYTADKPSIALKSELDGKQDKLTAGDNITIVNNVISSTGGGGGSVDLSAYAKTEDVNAGLATKQDTLIAGNGIIIEQNVISATGGSGGGGSVDLSEYAKTVDVNAGLATKQDKISDLATIREGAAKGATALQSYTETDPVYIADKPSLALKSEIPDISGKADKTLIVTETAGNSSYSIAPNRLTRLGTLASNVTLSLNTASEESGVANIYDIIFTTPTNAPSITWPEGITWVGGSAPAIAGGKTYEVSIMDNLATYGEY